jgi:phosphoribosylanthranilate isomerase
MTQVKICGITRVEDALCAAEHGADAIGFIFHPASPRYIEPQRAKAIIAALPPRLVKVGVFVNREAREAARIVGECGLDMIQLHGDESPGYCRRFPPERIIKAVCLRTAADLRALAVYNVRAFLPDARDANRYGGTGKSADWELAARLARERPLILAGGLGIGNIGEALGRVAPDAVDINSAIEISPGIKDRKRMARIIGLIRERTPGQGFPLFRIHPSGAPIA